MGEIGRDRLELDRLRIRPGQEEQVSDQVLDPRRPGIEIVGVQTSRFPAMFNAIKHAHHVMGSSTIAEGIAVASPAD